MRHKVHATTCLLVALNKGLPTLIAKENGLAARMEQLSAIKDNYAVWTIIQD